MLEGRSVEMFVPDKEATKGMTKKEKTAYYIHKFRMEEVARLQAEREV